ncbi:nucleoside triphosphate pyrophosphohydrolase [Desulfuromonas carbonis]|uniref:MazG family protein n=1 Tax=Desulfuromonas sp. DDH964 TaxID=1823759 RepID=UPI00078DAD4B|nr:MazG family protein [Desulfuromonas sp. DDH964]AMV72170.1 nucleoside triphosphate pyrophosphohydrolase [Desulfuromonas sp. DDH964]
MENRAIGRALCRLHRIMEILRSPGGCPWDAMQTTASLKPYLLEEVYELLEALDGGDPLQIKDELGDLLLQIVFHAQIFAEEEIFDLAAVANGISDKLERRHPHVFADSPLTTIDELNQQWDQIKRKEKPNHSTERNLLDGIPKDLPALARAAKFLERASRKSVLAPEAPQDVLTLENRYRPLVDAAANANDASRLEAAFGEFILATVAWGRTAGLDAEQALRQALNRHAGKPAQNLASHP